MIRYKIMKVILFIPKCIADILLYLAIRKKYIIMYNEDNKNIFSIYNREDVEYLL